MHRVHLNHYQYTPLKHGSLKTETKKNQKPEDNGTESETKFVEKKLKPKFYWSFAIQDK